MMNDGASTSAPAPVGPDASDTTVEDPAAMHAKEIWAAWLKEEEELGALLTLCPVTRVATGVNKCAMLSLLKVVGNTAPAGKRYEEALTALALRELAGTGTDGELWAGKKPGEIRNIVVGWAKGATGAHGYPSSVQVAGNRYFAVPQGLLAATRMYAFVTMQEQLTAASTSAPSASATGPDKLGMVQMMCADGKVRWVWTPHTKDLLADLQAEHTISATAAGKIAGRVLERAECQPQLSEKLLGGTTAAAGDMTGCRDLATRSLMLASMNARRDLARALAPVKGADGVWVRKQFSLTFDATTLQPTGRKVFQVSIRALDELGDGQTVEVPFDFPLVRPSSVPSNLPL